jgi:hypothetical protein
LKGHGFSRAVKAAKSIWQAAQFWQGTNLDASDPGFGSWNPPAVAGPPLASEPLRPPPVQGFNEH